MTQIACQGGGAVEIVDRDHWIAPFGAIHLQWRWHINFMRLPDGVRDWWRIVLAEAFRLDSLSKVRCIWNTALWFYRFHEETSRPVTVRWDEWEAADWGAYAQWLTTQRGIKGGRPLSLNYRRAHFFGLASAAEHAINLGLPGTTEQTVLRLKAVSRRTFRGVAAFSNRLLVRRALSRAQWDELDGVLAEEWANLLEHPDGPEREYRLSVVVATWLAFHHGLRSAEINRLTVRDILPDPAHGRHHLRVHAPNKQEDRIPIPEATLNMLHVLESAGTAVRHELKTDYLFVGGGRWAAVLATTHPNRLASLTHGLRTLIERYQASQVPLDIRFPDGRLTLGTHLAYDIANRERVRQMMRHERASTTERYYRAPDQLRVARDIGAAIRSEAVRLTLACQHPIVSLEERPGHQEVLSRNPTNAELEYGSCGLDVQRQGSCRMAVHCFECPLLVPWVSKRHNFVYERDVYEQKAAEAANDRDRENYLRHAALAEAHILWIDRRKEAFDGDTQSTRSRRPRR